MRTEDGVLYLDEAIEDESVEELVAILSQDDIKKVHISSSSIAPASLQLLLSTSKTKEVEVEDEFIKKLFENVVEN